MELSAEVKVLLHTGHKFNAIKQLRVEQHIGLREAKGIVDDYARQHPELIEEPDSTGLGSSLMVFATIGLMVYWFLNKG